MHATRRPFRFGVQLSLAASRQEWQELARRAEGLGYDVALMPDHLGSQFAVRPGLAAVAAATTRLRIGAFVLQNDLRHPAFTAMEAATLDVLSNGRFELGLGAGGSYLPDFETTGIPFAPPGVRVGRLIESVPIVKGLFADGPLTFNGQHHTVAGLEGVPKPVQRPYPPLLIGGGGPRVLALAAREADIVSVLPRMLPGGGSFHLEQASAEAFTEQVALLLQEAGARFPDLEVNVLVQQVRVTDDAPAVHEELSQLWTLLAPEQVRDSPYFLIGAATQIAETLQARRQRLGISYVVVFARDMEALAPVVAQLAGA
jgi:probable F420-dependent oxidoreductase